ncbi:MAG: trypsin-like peptidase domain-containing protein [Longimicrobiales bacterium]|nr:trypsin-like peptidase domain-containing protein [Longimicrobiales bacterium]
MLDRHGLSWLVTARHVKDAAKCEAQDRGSFVLVGTTGSGDQFPMHLGEEAARHGVEWIQSDEKEDLAAIPIPLSTEWVHRTIPESLCLTAGAVIPSMPCYTVGIPYGFLGSDPARITPLVLDGVVSGIDRGQGLLYISAPTFSGNSGGPAFVYRSPFNVAGGLTVGTPTVLFAGIVIQQMLVRGATGDPGAGIAYPPLHLGVVRSAERVLALLDGAEARGLVGRVKGNTADAEGSG